MLAPMYVLLPKNASADVAEVRVGDARDAGDGDEARYADPPDAHSAPIAIEDRGGVSLSRERYHAPFRMSLGPAAATTGHGLGLGIGAAIDLGSGSVGFRMAGAWMHGEAGTSSGNSSGNSSGAGLGQGIAQYSAEVTLDLNKRGDWHPVIGVGGGLLHVNEAQGSADAGVGTARFTLDYALAIDDAEVRVGAGVLGALTGPGDRELADLHAYAIVSTTLTIGF